MKILHIIYGLTIGGTESMLVDIINRQCVKHEVHLIVLNKYYSQSLIDKLSPNIRLHLINRKRKSRNPWPIIKMNLLVWSIYPDIIHTHNENISKYLFFMPAPMCRTCHSTGNDLNDYKRYNVIISISESVHKDLKERLGIESLVVKNGIDCSVIKTKNEDTNELFKIVQVGRLIIHHKGQDILIKACKQLINEGIKNIHLDIIGEGHDKNRLIQLINKLDVHNYITLIGSQKREYVYQHLCDYDLFVQPSRFEGFGLTVAEAMAAQIPVLVSNIEGPLEIIENGNFGFSFIMGNVEDCARQIKRIYNNQLSTDTYLNRKHIETEYNINNTVKGYERVYSNIINKK